MSAYKGPVICLTREEGIALLTQPDSPAADSAKAKITAAVDSDPKWREPLQ